MTAAQCPECRSALAHSEGGDALGCASCSLAWLPEAGQPEPDRFAEEFVAASGVAPTRCPACTTPTVRLGTVRNRLAYRCTHCSGGFVQTAGGGEDVDVTGFAVELAQAAIWGFFALFE